MDIKSLSEKYNDYIVEQRRYFHANPELSFEEVETTKVIKKQLEDMGMEVHTFPDYHGVLGYIRTGKNGKTVMLRADIDGLPVEEKTCLPFASKNGKMHACGHDTHMAMLLGGAKILTEIKDELEGDVAFLFQSAEELSYGAKYYVDKGIMKDIDAVFGMHIWGTLDAPLINVGDGNRMASCDNIEITINGSSTHGSSPHLGNDAIIAAASTIMNLQTFVSRKNNPLNTLVLSIGKINGGQSFNIIANEVKLEGTIRTFSREFRETIESEIKHIIDHTCEALGCTAELIYNHRLTPVINDHKDLNELARNAVVKLYGKEALTDMDPLTGSEDFSMLMDAAPGVFAFIGARNEQKGIVYTNHNDKFTVDEDSLQRGSALFAQFAVDFLAQ